MTRYQELRQQRGYTQLQIQLRTGIDQSDYSKIERGCLIPSYWQCRELARLFDVSMDYLAGLTNVSAPYSPGAAELERRKKRRQESSIL